MIRRDKRAQGIYRGKWGGGRRGAQSTSSFEPTPRGRSFLVCDDMLSPAMPELSGLASFLRSEPLAADGSGEWRGEFLGDGTALRRTSSRSNSCCPTGCVACMSGAGGGAPGVEPACLMRERVTSAGVGGACWCWCCCGGGDAGTANGDDALDSRFVSDGVEHAEDDDDDVDESEKVDVRPGSGASLDGAALERLLAKDDARDSDDAGVSHPSPSGVPLREGAFCRGALRCGSSVGSTSSSCGVVTMTGNGYPDDGVARRTGLGRAGCCAAADSAAAASWTRRTLAACCSMARSESLRRTWLRGGDGESARALLGGCAVLAAGEAVVAMGGGSRGRANARVLFRRGRVGCGVGSRLGWRRLGAGAGWWCVVKERGCCLALGAQRSGGSANARELQGGSEPRRSRR